MALLEVNVVYKGLPIAIATRGIKRTDYDIKGLEDVTDSFDYYAKIINPSQAGMVDIEVVIEKEQEMKSVVM